MDSTKILGVRIDKISLDQATDLVLGWVKARRKRVVFTPNIEFIMAAQKDSEFKKILNEADLAIPDSARLGWSERIVREKSKVKRFLIWPLFFFSKPLFKKFPVTTGTDLMENLILEISKTNEKAVTVGLLGGREGVALKLTECLHKKYPKLKISFTGSGGEINEAGEEVSSNGKEKNKKIHNSKFIIPATDILFVAFGHIKQEKWIYKHMNSTNAKVFIGVGGAFDYLSGEVKRAPGFIRSLGFEWLYRLMVQPWRIKRFVSLLEYLALIINTD